MHWAERRKVASALASAVWTACRPPKTPLARCKVLIERTSTQEPDRDNLYGGVKPLMDALQPASRRHPHGLGFIVDDGPACVAEMVVRHVPGKAKRTIVTIEELEASHG
jgi:Holliday junction resolvase RusA-like endonuclease